MENVNEIMLILKAVGISIIVNAILNYKSIKRIYDYIDKVIKIYTK